MNRFKLFSRELPEDFARRVIQSMPDIERISISFCSRRTKAMAVSPPRVIARRSFWVTIGGQYVSVYAGNARYDKWRNDGRIKEESIDLLEFVGEGNRRILWMQAGWSLFERVNHVNDLFPGVYSNVTFDSREFDLDLLPHIRRSDISEISVPESEQNNQFNLQILNFFNQEKTIRLGCPRFGSETEIANIPIRNLHLLKIHDGFKINFDELLLTNAQYIILEDRSFSAKHINKYLKLWMRGSNPRLRALRCLFDGPLPNHNLILTGTNSQLLPDTMESLFLDFTGHTNQIRGGHQIYNQYGIKGLVMFYEDTAHMTFFVIDDY